MRNSLCGSLAALAAFAAASNDLAAQPQTIVSPTSVGAGDGIGAANSFPWASSVIRRYMQVHSDLKGSVKVISKIATRRDGSAATSTNVRPVDLELFMGHSLEFDAVSYTMSNNYLTPRTSVMARTVINLGPCSTPGNPAPFEIQIPLSTPYVYTGVNSLAWEAVLYAASTPLPPVGDVHTSLQTAGTAANTTGPGCVWSGGTAAMTLSLAHVDSGGLYALGGYILNAPPNAPAFLAFGATNPNLSVGGLCSPLYTDLLAVVPVGTTDANGALRNNDETPNYAPPSMIFTAPNTFGGANLFLQAHVVDAGNTTGIPVANSDGKCVVVPVANASRVAQATRLFNNGNGVAATTAIFFSASTIGYALVTEFTY